MMGKSESFLSEAPFFHTEKVTRVFNEGALALPQDEV